MLRIKVNTMIFWICSLSFLGSLARTDVVSDNLVNLYSSLFRPSPEDSTQEKADENSRFFTSTENYITKHGYPFESHTVTTEDGYLLTVHRIPGSPKASPGGVKTPVLIQHGIFASSELWVMLGPERGLGFLLADQGYDVWMNNARGNTYSKNHTSLSTKSPDFWNFTWHEMGVYDLPAVIDYVLDTTNHTQLMYIGHSMGTTMFFVMASMRPEYNQKIRLMVAMAPVAFFQDGVHSRVINLFLPHSQHIYQSAKNSGIHDVLYRNTRVVRLLHTLCKDGQITQSLCLSVLTGIFGNNPRQQNKTLLPDIIIHDLDGSSTDTLYHYVQTMVTGRFQMFDHSGKVDSKMPEYDLSKVTCPVYLMYSLNDVFVDPKSVLKLNNSLSNVVEITQVADERAIHTDYIFANDVRQIFYDGLIDFLDNYKTSILPTIK